MQIPVKPRETLYVRVGGRGLGGDYPGSAGGGFNGGGSGGNGGYWGGHGGGGASDVREGGDRLKDRILVAGGGAGQGTGYYAWDCTAGNGGGTVGGNGTGNTQAVWAVRRPRRGGAAARAFGPRPASRDNQELTVPSVPAAAEAPVGKAGVTATVVAAAVAAAVITAAVAAAGTYDRQLNKPAAVVAAARRTSSRRPPLLGVGKAGSPLSTTAASSLVGSAMNTIALRD